MSWLQIQLHTSPDHAPGLAELLGDMGALAVSFEDGADDALYEPPPGSLPLWTHTRLCGLFPQGTDVNGIMTALRTSLGEVALLSIQSAVLEDRDWLQECRDRFRPRQFGDRLWVCPSWETSGERSGETPSDPTAVEVVLDPGLAFGTGAHPTTALCLKWLAQAPLKGTSVIDYGCGSGILAIAAARLGAQAVWAVDIDPQALQTTAQNAQINAVEVRPVVPDELPRLQADVLIANILARPLIDLAPDFARRVKPGGRLVLSGILIEQTAEVNDAYAPWFEMGVPAIAEGWARVQGVRR